VGLDTVELVMTVEKEFSLTIPDAAAAKMLTVGDLHSFLVTELQRLERPDVNEEHIFERLREIICAQLGVKPAAVVPSARFVADLGAD
jgi:acyl carrier protein